MAIKCIQSIKIYFDFAHFYDLLMEAVKMKSVNFNFKYWQVIKTLFGVKFDIPYFL